MTIRPYKPPDKGYYFKFYNGGVVSLVRFTLEDNGFRQADERNTDWSFMWATSTIKMSVYQSLTRFQMVNHFPKSTEICRKDAMYRHLAVLREAHG